ncbi:MAG: phage tail protein [Gammaproteobacteria bacterium]
MPNAPSSSARPSQVAHFRVQIGDKELAIHSVSTLHDLIASEADPALRMTITLRRAVGADRFLFRWYRDTTLGKNTATPLTIMLLDGADGEIVNRFGLENAQPVRWSGPFLDAQADAIAMEEIEVRYDAVHWLEP